MHTQCNRDGTEREREACCHHFKNIIIMVPLYGIYPNIIEKHCTCTVRVTVVIVFVSVCLCVCSCSVEAMLSFMLRLAFIKIYGAFSPLMISKKQPAADLLCYTSPPPPPTIKIHSERRPGDWEEMSTGVCVYLIPGLCSSPSVS